MEKLYHEYIKEFGFATFALKAIRSKTFRSTNQIAMYINQMNEINIKKLLKKYTDNYLELKNIKYDTGFKIDTVPIWIMWYQGEEEAPPLVKKCIESVKKNSSNHPVYLVTEKNLDKYLELPSFIKEKFEMGCISRTHLSDLIRLMLLNLYGGLWIDATVYCKDLIDESIFDYDFYSINTGNNTKDPSHGRWTTFFMFSKPNNQLVNEVLLRHLEYWKNHNVILDYIAFDYFIEIARTTSTENNEMISRIPQNNTDVFTLRKHLNDRFISWNQLNLNPDTSLFKLSWKEKFESEVDGFKTVYAHILES